MKIILMCKSSGDVLHPSPWIWPILLLGSMALSGSNLVLLAPPWPLHGSYTYQGSSTWWGFLHGLWAL